jgi:hypothetical protein
MLPTVDNPPERRPVRTSRRCRSASRRPSVPPTFGRRVLCSRRSSRSARPPALRGVRIADSERSRHQAVADSCRHDEMRHGDLLHNRSDGAPPRCWFQRRRRPPAGATVRPSRPPDDRAPRRRGVLIAGVAARRLCDGPASWRVVRSSLANGGRDRLVVNAGRGGVDVGVAVQEFPAVALVAEQIGDPELHGHRFVAPHHLHGRVLEADPVPRDRRPGRSAAPGGGFRRPARTWLRRPRSRR